jgi:putative DNA primase/helicase
MAAGNAQAEQIGAPAPKSDRAKARPASRYVIEGACAYSAPRKTMEFGEEGVSDVGLALYLVDSRLSPHTVHAEGHFWAFTGQRWEKIPQTEMEHLVRTLHRMPYKAKGENVELCLNDNRFPAIIRQLRSMLSYGKEDFFADAPAGFNCANGFVVFDEKTGTPAIEPHTPNQRQRHVMPGAWNPEKGSEPVRNVLRVPFKGDEDAEDKVRLQGQAIAVGMLGMGGRRNSKIVLFKGEANCGKSAFIDMVKGVLPEGSWDAVPPEEWGNPNMRFSLVGKAVNLVPALTNNKVIPEN